jgi:outer membrane lipoprotein LolB
MGAGSIRRLPFALVLRGRGAEELMRTARRAQFPRFGSLRTVPACLLPGRGACLVALFALTLAFSGCKTLPPQTVASVPWDVRRVQLQAREQFDLSGRIAVAAANEGFSAKLRWEQQGERSNVALDGPLGVGGVRILTNGTSLTVMNARGEQLDSETAHAELAARLGFEPPLSSLRYWVLGVPDPAYPAEEVLDDQQRLVTLRQEGWLIEYTGYSAVNGHWLPSRMTLRRNDVRVRLLVDRWNS